MIHENVLKMVLAKKEEKLDLRGGIKSIYSYSIKGLKLIYLYLKFL